MSVWIRDFRSCDSASSDGLVGAAIVGRREDLKVFRRSCWRGMETGERSMGSFSFSVPSFWDC